jgi:undecaprenyl-diphosphatase
MTEQTSRTTRLRGWRYQIAVLAAILLAGLLTYVARTVLYFPIDVQITQFIQVAPPPAVVRFLDMVSWIGFPPQSNVIFGAIILGLFIIGRRIEAAMLLFAAVGSATLWYWMSAFIDRPRPSPELVRVAAELPRGGFPSGHVLNLTAMLGFMAYLAMLYVKNSLLRWLLVVVLAVPVVTIGVARVYAGAHWPSDALGGYLIGGIWLALTIQLYRWAGARLRHHTTEPDTALDETGVGSGVPEPAPSA